MLFTRLLDMLHKKERGKKKLTVRNNHADIFPRKKAPVAPKRLACSIVSNFFLRFFQEEKENRQNKKKPIKRKIVTNYFLFCLRNSADDNFFKLSQTEWHCTTVKAKPSCDSIVSDFTLH